MQMSRAWAMPSPATFSIPPIEALLRRYLKPSMMIVDPCCGDSLWANFSNDLNPKHAEPAKPMEAKAFLDHLYDDYNLKADAILIDPPYSPRQIAEVYKSVGRSVGMETTQNARLYREIKDAANRIAGDGCIAICCGWNSAGMGRKRGWELIEVLLVAHGSAHNDTIVTVEKKMAGQLSLSLGDSLESTQPNDRQMAPCGETE